MYDIYEVAEGMKYEGYECSGPTVVSQFHHGDLLSVVFGGQKLGYIGYESPPRREINEFQGFLGENYFNSDPLRKGARFALNSGSSNKVVLAELNPRRQFARFGLMEHASSDIRFILEKCSDDTISHTLEP